MRFLTERIAQKIRLAAYLAFLFAFVGCGNSNQNFVITGGGVALGNGNLTVSLTDTNFVPSSVAQIQIDVYNRDTSLNSTQTVPRADSASFGLAEGTYLVRLTGLDGNGNVVGYFDAVVVVQGNTVLVIPGLRGGTPPPVAFPDPNTGSPFFLFIELPETVIGGQEFSVTLKAFDAQGLPLEQTVSGVSLSGAPIAIASGATTLNTESNGEVTFNALTFEAAGLGATNLTATSPGYQNSLSPEIVVAPLLQSLSRNSSGEVADGGSGRTGPLVSSPGSGPNADDDPFGAKNPATSADGRFVAFQSHSTNLVPNDTNNTEDIFVYDRQNNTVERVSVSTAGVQGDFQSSGPDISGDGRFVVFDSDAMNLVPNDTNGNGANPAGNGIDIFLHDRQTGETTRISVDENGNQRSLSGYIDNARISADGRFACFQALDLLTNTAVDDNDRQAYVRELATGNIEIVSVDSMGNPSTTDSRFRGLDISGDGNIVAFTCEDAFVPEDTNNRRDIYLRNRSAGTTILVSRSFDGTSAQNDSLEETGVSANGNFVVFYSDATNLVTPAPPANINQVYVYDVAQNSMELISRDENGNPLPGDSESTTISADGRFVVYNTEPVPDNGNTNELYLFDRQTGQRSLISADAFGNPAIGPKIHPEVSGNGNVVVFASLANLIPGGNLFMEIFARLNFLAP